MAKHKRNARGEADAASSDETRGTETATLEAEAAGQGDSIPADTASSAQRDGGDTGDAVSSGAIAQDDPAALAEELEAARRSAAESMDAMLRARAELDNVRKRAEREVDSARKYALERFMSELLAVRDSMELGLGAAREADADLARLREGMELTLKLFDAAGAKFGLEEVDPRGAAFDPELHQAMSVQESADADAGTVITVVQKGYKLNDRLLRPAMVIVAK